MYKTKYFERGKASLKALLFLPLAFGTHAETSLSQPLISAGGEGSNFSEAACAGCHGNEGDGNAAEGIPRLRGLSATYLREQLQAFASDERKNPVMNSIAQTLSTDGITHAANYYAQLPPLYRPLGVKAESDNELATHGRWSENIPSCDDCHGPEGKGVGENFPALNGQPALYLENQLQAFQKGSRPPGPLHLMKNIAKKLSDADIRTISLYYSGSTPMTTGGQP
ncbi:cytochrome c-552 precursor [Ferrovum myxofaciens]|uniref:Cytochrome c-552 n=1 Tax=Ferrovum myxofaciens TaxID=416213 RepID=A0A149VYR6_9PROT|nr:c-type cytochrome [Ferrovum myxofaciens]KXW58357.1 cytochrome c-552 precursor [Ferrovum myxofaciens]